MPKQGERGVTGASGEGTGVGEEPAPNGQVEQGRKDRPSPRLLYRTRDGELVRLYLGDVTDTLRILPSRSVQMVATSPPYWGLRDYGTGEWEGGDPSCDHKRKGVDAPKDPTSTLLSRATNQNHEREPWPKSVCGKCGARRVDLQLGSEPSPDCGTKGQAQCGKCFVCSMVQVFRELKRVLRRDGTIWLNLGDSYGTPGTRQGDRDGAVSEKTNEHRRLGYQPAVEGIAGGNLVGVPWRVALALQADGWILRQEIIWHKPSPMPESVTNRCTKAHEQIFLLTLSSDYFYDAEAIKEASRTGPGLSAQERKAKGSGGMKNDGVPHRSDVSQGYAGTLGDGEKSNKRSVWSIDDEQSLLTWLRENEPEALLRFLGESRNKGDVWRVSSKPYPGAHFATYPPKLIEPCIKAGTSEYGACPKCLAPWERIIEASSVVTRPAKETKYGEGEEDCRGEHMRYRSVAEAKTLGWRPGCSCYKLERIEDPPPKPARKVAGTEGESEDAYAKRLAKGWAPRMSCWRARWERLRPLYEEQDVVPCRVLDIFIGSGTTASVCIALRRRCWGIDLSEDYLRKNAIPRIEGELLSRPALARLAMP